MNNHLLNNMGRKYCVFWLLGTNSDRISFILLIIFDLKDTKILLAVPLIAVLEKLYIMMGEMVLFSNHDWILKSLFCD